jgi:addiction module RelB/DinJ family antitoxin
LQKEALLAQTSINIRIDENVKSQAEILFSELGLSTSAAFNIFVRQAIREQAIPFQVTRMTTHGKPRLGGWEGRVTVSDDFNEPLDDFKEYQ